MFPLGIIIPPSSFTSALTLSGSNFRTTSVSPLSTNKALWLGLTKRSVVSRTNTEKSSTSSNNLLGNLTPAFIVLRSNKNFSFNKLLISYFCPSFGITLIVLVVNKTPLPSSIWYSPVKSYNPSQ